MVDNNHTNEIEFYLVSELWCNDKNVARYVSPHNDGDFSCWRLINILTVPNLPPIKYNIFSIFKSKVKEQIRMLNVEKERERLIYESSFPVIVKKVGERFYDIFTDIEVHYVSNYDCVENGLSTHTPIDMYHTRLDLMIVKEFVDKLINTPGAYYRYKEAIQKILEATQEKYQGQSEYSASSVLRTIERVKRKINE